MQQFFIQHNTMLGLVAALLGAIAFVFGSNGLGRFSGLNKKGGFSRALLIAVPAGVMMSVSLYVSDVIAHGLVVTQPLNRALHTQFTIIQIAVVEAILVALAWLSALLREDRKDRSSGVVALLELPLDYVNYALRVAVSAWFVFGVLGWFKSYQPPLAVFLIAGILLWLLAVIAGVLMESAKKTDNGSFYVVGLVLSAPTVLINLITIIVSIGIVYLVGWATAVVALVTIAAALILGGLWVLVNSLNVKAYLSIFALMGAAASVIKFGLDHISLLPR